MKGTLLEFDHEAFTRGFTERAMKVRHSLAGHELFTLDALARVADTLPRASIERSRAKNLPAVVPGGAPPVDGPPSETVREIEHNGCWMVMWYIERDPAYGALLHGCLDEAQPYVPKTEGEMRRREEFLFLSAPGSVTPVHIDPEHNFLLQIRGTKEFTTCRFRNSEAQLRELNRLYDGGHRNLDEMPSGESTTFRLAPGEGVYVPSFLPHWVKNGDEVSVSLSITFRSQRGLQFEAAHIFNAYLRRLHLASKPPGQSPVIDRAKAAVIVTAYGLAPLIRRLGIRHNWRRG